MGNSGISLRSIMGSGRNQGVLIAESENTMGLVGLRINIWILKLYAKTSSLTVEN